MSFMLLLFESTPICFYNSWFVFIWASWTALLLKAPPYHLSMQHKLRYICFSIMAIKCLWCSYGLAEIDFETPSELVQGFLGNLSARMRRQRGGVTCHGPSLASKFSQFATSCFFFFEQYNEGESDRLVETAKLYGSTDKDRFLLNLTDTKVRAWVVPVSGPRSRLQECYPIFSCSTRAVRTSLGTDPVDGYFVALSSR